MKQFLTRLTDSRIIKCVLFILILLVVADGVLTNILVQSGIAHEWNPFLKSLAGEPLLVALKIVGALVCAFVLWDIYRHWRMLGALSSYTFLTLYLIIVLWNGSLLLTH